MVVLNHHRGTVLMRVEFGIRLILPAIRPSPP